MTNNHGNRTNVVEIKLVYGDVISQKSLNIVIDYD